MPFTDGQTFLESVDKSPDGALQVSVVFVNAEQTSKQRIVVSLSSGASVESIKATLRSIRNGLDTASDNLKLLVPGPVDLTATVPVSPPPTPEQTFLLLYRQLQSAQHKVDAGIVDAGAKEIIDLLAATKAAYSPAFVGIG